MKNDSFLSIAMDLAGENASSNEKDDSEMDFTNGSCYNQGEAFEPQQSGNVNSSPSQWPLRHNNQSLEKNTWYSCNGFLQAKNYRCTYTGRISRTPSRYLDTDSDSGDGSVKKDCEHRLKIKRSRRRRKLPSGTGRKVLANGFKEHENSALPSVENSEVKRITENFGDGEWLASVEYPDVLKDSSPISNDKVSHLSPNTNRIARSLSNASLGNEIICSEGNYSNAKDVHVVVNESNRTADHSLKSSGRCVDIYTNENNARPRSLEFKDEGVFETCDAQTEKLESISKTLTKVSSKRKALHEFSKSDSSAKETVVSSKQLLNDCQLSCAIHNDSTVCPLESENCKECKGCIVDSSCISAKIVHNVDKSESGLCRNIASGTGNKLSNKKRLVKTTNRSNKKRRSRDTEAEGLESGNSVKMRKAMAKRFKQKHLRRIEKTDKNDVSKRNKTNGLICKVKEKEFDPVNGGKQGKQTSKVNKNVKKVARVKETQVAKSSKSSNELHSVLGMRRSPSGVYEFLVQWHNGTSCWVSSDDVVTDKHNYYLREYLVQSEQDVSVVNRVPFQAYCCDSLSLKECKPAPKSKTALRKMLCVEGPVQKKLPLVPTKQKDVVNVEYEESYCYVTLNRETCKRKSTCTKIVMHLITALEDAATSECEVVVIRGLQSDMFCGLRLDDMSKTGVEKENGILSQARYLVQTLTSYPKLLIALITKPARGIGAVLLSLCDMICDEKIWDQKQVLDRCKEGSEEFAKVCALPRLTGHSFLGEEILMGKRTEDLEHCDSILCSDETSLDDCSTVSRSLMEVNTILRRLEKRSSLLRVNGEIFPGTDSHCAFFVHGLAAADGDNLVASKTMDRASDHETLCESNSLFADQNISTDQSISTDQCSADHFTCNGISAEPGTIDDVVTHRSTTKHMYTCQNTALLDSNIHDFTRKQNSVHDTITAQYTCDQRKIVETSMDCTDSEPAVCDWSYTELSTNDHVVSQSCTMAGEADNNRISDTMFVDQATTETCSLSESGVGNTCSDDQNMNSDMSKYNVTGAGGPQKTTDIIVNQPSDKHKAPDSLYDSDHETVKTANTTEVSLYGFSRLKAEYSTNQTYPYTDTKSADFPAAEGSTQYTQTLTDCKPDDVTLASSNVTDGTISYSRSDYFTTENNEEHAVKLLTSTSDVASEHEETGDMCAENTEYVRNVNKRECSVSENCTSEAKSTEKECTATHECVVMNDVGCNGEPTMENIEDETSKQVVRGNAGNAGNPVELEDLADSNESLKLEKKKERANGSTSLSKGTSCHVKLTATSDVDAVFVNNATSTDSCSVEHRVNLARVSTDERIISERTSASDYEISSSTSSVAAAVDRYIKKLQAQIENEKQQTKQLHFEQVSRFPFVYKND